LSVYETEGSPKEQLDTADLLYYDQIANNLKTALGFSENTTLSKSAHAHASMFSDKFIAELPNELATQFLRRLRFKFADDEKLCRSIAQLFTEKRISEFDDRTMNIFAKSLQQVLSDIDQATTSADCSQFDNNLTNWLVENRQEKITKLFNDLAKLTGDTTALEFVNSLAKAKEGRA
jgi:hypothetical protein